MIIQQNVIQHNIILGKEDEWPTIKLARLLGSKDAINRENIIDDDGVEIALKTKMDDMRKSAFVGMHI